MVWKAGQAAEPNITVYKPSIPISISDPIQRGITDSLKGGSQASLIKMLLTEINTLGKFPFET